ncbi:MAG: bifunctional UDP-N-acetylglucosamine diphosphorylase/glucosamine-1-phosphate N-acetyltransferase GlmU [Bacillota bacterium]|nr:bifunctional UDP-N-acetylglucosamine diphosphorylase/glucosamine-1-phosphate N-acetyltransferase GlmU [Bacillota bacterium]
MKATALILAAGQGTRMKSETPKVLHKICGKEMLGHVLDAVENLGAEQKIVIVGHGAGLVTEQMKDRGLTFVHQKEQLGTGHAVITAQKELPEEGIVLVMCGDTPLITGETLKEFAEYHIKENNSVSVLTAVLENPFGYGRIVKDSQGRLLKIVEEKDADDEIKRINEINSGMYCFDAASLKRNLGRISNNNAQGEYYLTDLIEIAVMQNEKTGAFPVKDNEEIMGVNNRVQMADAEGIMRRRINNKHMLEGVSMINPEAVYIDTEAVIGRDTVLYPGVIITGRSVIGEGCIIGQNSRIENSVIGRETEIQSSTIIDSKVGDKTSVGPYAYLRPGSNVGSKVKIGDFVEVKNASIGDGSKASHLSYIGDADVGRDVNIGCGVVFVNYDGVNKFRTTVEDEAFIGSNSNLVAPVHVEKNGYVAAGSTITRNVPMGALVVGRPKDRVIPGWGERKMKEKKEKKNVK